MRIALFTIAVVLILAVGATAIYTVDRAEFVSIDEARKVIHVDQAAFLDRLLAVIAKR